ncbi:MAG: hypothetical protein K2M06_04090 [Muribaculaceae bacterium]|nr:hypothetical protein [Muribaculaceae bacterium]
MEHNIRFTSEAITVIEGLRHSAGTLSIYQNTLTRLFKQVLHAAEDLGMDDIEAIETLRVLDMIRADLTAIATTPSSTPGEEEEPTVEIVAEPLEEECKTEKTAQFQDKKVC